MKRMLSSPAADTRDETSPAAAAPTAAERSTARRALDRALADHGLRPPAAAERLADYLALLIRWRKRRRLAGPQTPVELAVEAIVDALRIDGLVPPDGDLVDVGSGAGFPGIPLALLGRRRRVTLVEPKAARAALLRVAAATLGRPDLRVRAGRGEDLAADVEAGREPAADAAVARALRPPDEWLALGRRLVRPGGVVLVLAGGSWTGPGESSGVTVAERLSYRLRGRRRRSAWRLVVPHRPT